MSAYLTPGVYRWLRPAEGRGVQLVRTDVAGFVGFAERGPLPGITSTNPKDLAIRLTGWEEFVKTFGGFIPHGYLAYAVRAFFENGGKTCYVVRVAATEHDNHTLRPRVASLALPDQSPTPQQSAIQLIAEAQRGRSVSVGAGAQIAPGQLVRIGEGALAEYAMVVGREGNQLSLGRKLGLTHQPGETVTPLTPALTVTALSPGNWGQRIKLTITPFERGKMVTEFAMRVRLDRGRDLSQPPEEEFYSRLSLNRDSPFYAPDRVNRTSQLVRVEVESEDSRLLVSGGPLAQGPVRLQGGQDGLSQVRLRDFVGGMDILRGARLLEEVDEVSILCAPDAVFAAPPVPPPPPAPGDLAITKIEVAHGHVRSAFFDVDGTPRRSAPSACPSRTSAARRSWASST